MQNGARKNEKFVFTSPRRLNAYNNFKISRINFYDIVLAIIFKNGFLFYNDIMHV